MGFTCGLRVACRHASGYSGGAMVCASWQLILRRGDRIVRITLATACTHTCCSSALRCNVGAQVLRLHAGMHAQGADCLVLMHAAHRTAPLALDRWRFSPAAVLRSPHTQWWPAYTFKVPSVVES